MCDHKDGFIFHTCKAGSPLPGAWFCNNNCGFYLPFDPEQFHYGPYWLTPSSHSMAIGEPYPFGLVDYFPNGLSYLPEPKGQKTLPKFAVEGERMKNPKYG